MSDCQGGPKSQKLEVGVKQGSSKSSRLYRTETDSESGDDEIGKDKY